MVLMEIQRHRQVWDLNRTLGERTRRSLAAQTFVGWLNTTCHIATESLGKTKYGDLKACLAYAKIVCMLVITSHFSSRSERVSQSRSGISLLRLSRPPYHPKYSFSFSQISRNPPTSVVQNASTQHTRRQNQPPPDLGVGQNQRLPLQTVRFSGRNSTVCLRQLANR